MISELCLILIIFGVSEVFGHGMMLKPAGRSSLWRVNNQAPPNYDDNALFCGGAYVQNEINGGKCGVCGDPYNAAHPQDNENTGTYGRGIVAETYKPDEVIDVYIMLTANHLGSFTYSLCELPDPNAPEPGEECFGNLLLEDGSESVQVTSNMYQVYNRVALPNITCKRCVLRWHYRGGNNWGVCEDGSQALGCGPQEVFRACADIAILPNSD